MPPWYAQAERWLNAQGWGVMALIAVGIVAVTLWLLYLGHAIPLAAWLTYLLMP